METFDDWCKRLGDSGFLVGVDTSDGRTTYGLKAPYRLHIRPSVVRRLVARYNPRKEIGGVLAARPMVRDGTNELDVTRAYILQNRSDKPHESYLASNEDRIEAIGKCFGGTAGGIRYLPFEFHSHPSDRQDMKDAPYSFLREFFNLETSDKDKTASQWAWTYGQYTLWLPRILVSRLNDELFVGVYGGGSAPNDFKDFMLKAVGETGGSLLNLGLDWAEDSGWKKGLVVAGFVGYLFVAGISMLAPGGLQNLAITMLETRVKTGTTNYFGFTKGEALTIEIPVPNKPRPA